MEDKAATDDNSAAKGVVSARQGWLALSPLILFLAIYLGGSILSGDFYAIPITMAFLIASCYAVAITGKLTMEERIKAYSKGAAQPGIMMMVWIFVLAGAFASSAKQTGAIDQVVNVILWILPGNLTLAGMFLAACFMSLSIGTSVGTIAALVPIAAAMGPKIGVDIATMTAIVAGGSFFGDNLSFISDTTIAATQTMGCAMRDKFKVNIQIVLPAAVLVMILYVVMGLDLTGIPRTEDIDFWKIIPYLMVFCLTLSGMNVLTVLLLGLLSTGIITLCYGNDILTWMSAAGDGIMGMTELIMVTLMAGGMLELIRIGGGIDFIITSLSPHLKNKLGTELGIAALTGFTNVCTANNTIAILTAAPIIRPIADSMNVDRRKVASIMDTFSCLVQALIPYGAQILIACSLSGASPIELISRMYYPMVMGLIALLAIIVRFPRKYS